MKGHAEDSPVSPSADGYPAVLDVRGLSLKVADLYLTQDVSLTINPGEMLGLVGESGCGKSVTALSILRLLPEPPIRIAAGKILFSPKGGPIVDLAAASGKTMQQVRGRSIGMIFQEPMTSLNPVFRVGDQIAEPLMIHAGLNRQQARARAADLLDTVGVTEPKQALERYPHQMSGGQRQRVMIAIALACEPELLIADEPTTALDVTVQAQVLALIAKLQRERGLACLLITHDLGVVAQVCSRAMIMYAGRIVEEGPVAELFANPRHRYTRALVDTIPARNPPGTRLPAIPGTVPTPGARGKGCAFAPRCTASRDICQEEAPPRLAAGRGFVSCWNPVS
jgi:oligopeptide/dipeptide ABC transporter ATP-binding protein